MTSRAVGLPQMLRMVENDIKTPERRKPFDTRGRVTNRTDRMLVSGGKLLRVTTRTGQMPGQFRRRRIILALVTEQAGKPRVLLVRVLKPGVILGGTFAFFGQSFG